MRGVCFDSGNVPLPLQGIPQVKLELSELVIARDLPPLLSLPLRKSGMGQSNYVDV